jgi:hypothetical protein
MSEFPQEPLASALAAHPDARRRHPRVPFVTAVEVETPTAVVYGFSENISVGGMLVRSESAIAPGTPGLTTFILRDSGRVQLESRIVHCRSGVRFGVQFVGLTDEQRTLLSKFAQPTIAIPRRSSRIPVRLFLELSWVNNGGLSEAAAETVLLSRHGCLVLTKAAINVGSDISLRWTDAGIAARARIVSRQDSAGDLPRIAIEFIGTDSFWGSYFPAEA